MKKDFKNIYSLYTQLKTVRERYKARLWNDISKFVGIAVDPDYQQDTQPKTDDLDEFVDDPTSAISVNQAGDYMLGIMWGTGEDVFKIVPSRYVTELVDSELVQEWYDFASDQTLYHMNHADCGYTTALRPYAYDQQAYGTSGIGIFPNKSFINRVADNALIARNYGVDNICIASGKNGVIDIVFATYKWKVNQIIAEFCMTGNSVDNKLVAKLPRPIQQACNKNNINEEFIIVFGSMPRDDYDPKLKGKRGTRYRGVWFMEKESAGSSIFFEEDFAERPISIARAILVRGEDYGRSGGTMLLSTIRSVNYMTSSAIQIIEKMANPSLGLWSNAIFGDSVLDTSAEGLTIFNQSLMGNAQAPTFPLYDVGDPSALVEFLIPYLNEKITTAFKIDALLDFSSAKEMSATESLQRYAIRGKSLSGMLLLQKNERLVPDARRAISILYNMNELGVNPNTMKDAAKKLKAAGRQNRVIPDAVLKVMESGRPWYELRWNNELEKLVRTEAVQNLIQILQAIGGIAALYPDIINAVNWYKLLKDINDNLDANNQILISEDEFKKIVADMAKQKMAAMALQAGQASAEIDKNSSQANKNNTQATNGK